MARQPQSELAPKRRTVNWPAIASVIAALAAAAGVYYTGRSLDATRAQTTVTEQGQFTDRYSHAIEQLGRQGPDQLQIRLGGIYALERLARDSPRDQSTIIEVLTAFVRTSTHPNSVETSGPDCPDTPPTPDIQAALTVLGRRVAAHDGDAIIKLNNLCLPGANLEAADLSKAILDGTDLRKSIFVGAQLEGTQFLQANLSGAQLWNADLSGAHLERANLTDADLMDSKLAGADLSWITINGNTNFIGVDLGGARLEYAPPIRR
jgi:hypothetical protein